MCSSGECHDCSILADLDAVPEVECIQCGEGGELVEHARELMHAGCVEAFEVMTDNAAAGAGR